MLRICLLDSYRRAPINMMTAQRAVYRVPLLLLLWCHCITAEHVDCRSLPVTACTDHKSCAQCINSITRKSFCMSREDASKHKGGVIECFDVPPTPPGPGSCTGQLEANCKPPCVWCKGRFPGLSGCFDKVGAH